jgi:hypothetical protein
MSWTNQTKNIASFSNRTKNDGDFDSGLYFLLTELSGYLLQENNGKIILQESTNYKKSITWTNRTKN